MPTWERLQQKANADCCRLALSGLEKVRFNMLISSLGLGNVKKGHEGQCATRNTASHKVMYSVILYMTL